MIKMITVEKVRKRKKTSVRKTDLIAQVKLTAWKKNLS